MKTNLSKSHIKDTVTYKNTNDRISGQLSFLQLHHLGLPLLWSITPTYFMYFYMKSPRLKSRPA